MRTSSRTLVVTLFDEVEALDVGALVGVLTTAGRQWNFRPFRIVPAAAKAGLVETRSQIRLEATVSLDAAPTPEIVVVPGGYGARRAQKDAELIAWLGRAGQGASHVLATGNGVLLLAKAGLLPGVEVAVRDELRAELTEIAPEALVAAESCAVSGKFFTAASSGEAAHVALCLVAQVLGEKQARAVAASLGLPWAAGPDTALEVIKLE